MSSGAPEGLPPGMSPEEAQAMQQALDAELTRITTIAQIYYAAVIAVVIWDWILNLTKEYQLIWKAKWSAGKVAYILARYTTTWFAVVIVSVATYGDFTYEACTKYVKVNAFLAVLVTMSCETVLGLRAWSVWDRNLWLTAYLVLHWTAVFAVLLANVATAVEPAPIVGDSGPCNPSGSGFFISFWVVILSYEVTTTILMSVRSVQIMHKNGYASASNFMRVLLRDGLIYAFVVVILNTINIGLVLQTDNPFIKGVHSAPATYLTAVACCHLILSLRNQTGSADGSGSRDLIVGGNHFRGKDSSTHGSSSDKRQSQDVGHEVPVALSHRKPVLLQNAGRQDSDMTLDHLKNRSSPDLTSNIDVHTEVQIHRSEPEPVYQEKNDMV